MKVFVSTKETQGQRRSDFSFTNDEELVRFPAIVCAADRGDPDGRCGCGRSFIGLDTRKGTTTAKVAEMRLTRGRLAELLAESTEAAGFGKRDCRVAAATLAAVAKLFNVGTVVEHRNGQVWPRKHQGEGWTPERIARCIAQTKALDDAAMGGE
jgi:hypothetical protein